MNSILKYGEFKYPQNESFNRWGGRIDFPRNYLRIPPKKSIQDIDTETIFTGIDLNGFSNSKLIIDMETEDLIINKNEIIYKTIDPQFSMNQIVSTQKSVVSETEEQIITNAEEISKQQTEELSISKKEMELSNNITIDVQSSRIN